MQTAIPESRQAVVVDEQGQTLSVRRIPVPKPGPGQVLIRMGAAPINPSDLGGVGLLPRWLLGRRVTCSTPSGGTWAEYLVVPARNCFPLRKSLSLEEGSMLIVNPLTAVAFFKIAKQGKHRAMINNAAAGALGQMIRRLGQTKHISIIHIVRRDEHVELLRSMGAEHVLNSSDTDFTHKLRQLSHQLNATLILDPVGGEHTRRLLDLAPGKATALLYGSLSGIKRDLAIQNAGNPTKHVRGFFMPDWLATKSIWHVLGYLNQVQSLAKKELHTEIQQRFPLTQVQDAIELYQTNASAGKVLLIPK